MASASTSSYSLPPVAEFFGLNVSPVVCNSSVPKPELSAKEDWEIAAALLRPIDADVEHYTLRDLCPVLGKAVNPQMLSAHARDLFRPKMEGNFRLQREHAIKLIKRYCLVGQKRFLRIELEALWTAKFQPQTT